MLGSTPSCEQRELEKIENVYTIACFPCLFFDLLLLPSGLGGRVYTMVRSTPSCKQRELEKFEILYAIACFPCLFFDLLLLPSGLGGLFIPWCEALLHASNTSLRIY